MSNRRLVLVAAGWMVAVATSAVGQEGTNPYLGNAAQLSRPTGPVSGAGMPAGTPAGQPPAPSPAPHSPASSETTFPQDLAGTALPATRIELVFINRHQAVLRIPTSAGGTANMATMAGGAGQIGQTSQQSYEITVRPGGSFPYGARRLWATLIPADDAVELRLGPKDADLLVAVIGINMAPQQMPTVSNTIGQVSQQPASAGTGVANILSINTGSNTTLLNSSSGSGSGSSGSGMISGASR